MSKSDSKKSKKITPLGRPVKLKATQIHKNKKAYNRRVIKQELKEEN